MLVIFEGPADSFSERVGKGDAQHIPIIASRCDTVGPGKWDLRNYFVNGLDGFDPDQFLIEAGVEIGEAIGVESQLM